MRKRQETCYWKGESGEASDGFGYFETPNCSEKIGIGTKEATREPANIFEQPV